MQNKMTNLELKVALQLIKKEIKLSELAIKQGDEIRK